MTNTPQEFSPDLQVAQETLQPFDVREREGLNPMIKLAMVAAFLLLLAVIVMKLYTPGVRDRSDPPRITADNTPFKVAPEDAGGTQTPNQDKVVFEVMDGNSPDTTATPEPRPEAPIKMEAPEPVVTAPVREPVPAPRPATRPVVKQPPVSVPATGNSEWVVQVASTRSRADAADVWQKLKVKFPTLVDGKYGDVKRVDLGDKGIYFRTRVAGLADKAAADSMCKSFKAAGQACFLAKK
jgi:cytoskeletal protein RodZ